MNQLSLEEILSSLIILFGNSGAGKGDTAAEIKKRCEDLGINFASLATGDGFRGLSTLSEADKNEDIRDALQLMSQGGQAEGLWVIQKNTIDRIKEHILKLEAGEKSFLCLDGYWRNGEDISKLVKDMRLPSQGLQLSGMIFMAIKQLIDDGNIKLTDEDNFLLGITPDQEIKRVNHDDLGISRIYDLLLTDATKIVVHVTEQDARDLMRYRSYKELDKLYWNLVISADGDLRKEKLLEAVHDLLLIQSGNFRVQKDGNVVLDNILIASETKPFEINETEHLPYVDKEVKEICVNALRTFKTEAEIEKAIKGGKEIGTFIKLFRELGISTELRADDMDTVVVEKRITENRDKVEGNVFKEVGISVDASGQKPELRTEGIVQKVILVRNEINRTNPIEGYKRFMGEVSNCGDQIFRIHRDILEGQGRSGERI